MIWIPSMHRATCPQSTKRKKRKAKAHRLKPVLPEPTQWHRLQPVCLCFCLRCAPLLFVKAPASVNPNEFVGHGIGRSGLDPSENAKSWPPGWSKAAQPAVHYYVADRLGRTRVIQQVPAPQSARILVHPYFFARAEEIEIKRRPDCSGRLEKQWSFWSSNCRTCYCSSCRSR